MSLWILRIFIFPETIYTVNFLMWILSFFFCRLLLRTVLVLECLVILSFFKLQKVVNLIKLLIILIKADLICSNKLSMANFILEQIPMHLEQNCYSYSATQWQRLILFYLLTTPFGMCPSGCLRTQSHFSRSFPMPVSR